MREVARAGEWWEYKLVPVFALFYGTAFVAGVPLTSLWRTAIVILLALVPGAAYVSIINDLSDREDDRAAGKPNRMAGRTAWTAVLLIAATTAPGFVFSWLWRNDPPLATAYLCAWLAYSLYSLPPFRFKTRGFAGVLCDACGAHVFPTLVAVFLVGRDSARPITVPWVVAAGLWSLAYGVRGILWHQLLDRDRDAAANVRTFAQRHRPQTSARLATFAAFPLEIASLAGLLVQLRSVWPIVGLAAYTLLSLRRMWSWRMQPVIVVTKPRLFLVLHEYYDVFLPLSLVVAAGLRNPLDFLVIPVHLALFPRRAFRALSDAVRLRPRLIRRGDSPESTA